MTAFIPAPLLTQHPQTSRLVTFGVVASLGALLAFWGDPDSASFTVRLGYVACAAAALGVYRPNADRNEAGLAILVTVAGLTAQLHPLWVRSLREPVEIYLAHATGGFSA